MKKVFLVTLLIGLILVSCKKENNENLQNSLQNEFNPLTLSLNITSKTELDLEKELFELAKTNSMDYEDAIVSEAMYYFSKAFTKLCLKQEYLTLFIEEAKKNYNKEVNLRDFFQKNEVLRNQMSLQLSQIENVNFNSWEKIEANMIYKDFQYFPGLYIPNVSIANVKNGFILSPGIEASDNELNNIIDEVAAWYYNNSQELFYISIGEQKAHETNVPVFLITTDYEELYSDIEEFYFDDYAYHNRDNSNNENLEKSINSTVVYRRIRVNYAYEGGNNASEVSSYAYAFGCGNVEFTTQRVIPRNDIGKWLWIGDNYLLTTGIPKFCNINSTKNLNFNTFERDWNNSKKDLFLAKIGNGSNDAYCNQLGILTKNIKGRRKYYNEWYEHAPFRCPISLVDFQIFSNNQEIIHNYQQNKGGVYLKRVDN